MRGALGMGIVWAVAWGIPGMVPRWVLGFNADVPFPLVFGVLGFIAGVTFSALLVAAEGRRTFNEMTIPRLGAWGAAGGLLLSGFFSSVTQAGWRR